MLNHGNSWSPDTCDCELHYLFDDSLPADQIVRVPQLEDYADTKGQSVKIKQLCKVHGNVSMAEIHDLVLKENQTKNVLHGHIKDNHPELEKDFNWKFTGQDHNRVLEVDFKGKVLTPQQQASLDGAITKLAKPVTIKNG